MRPKDSASCLKELGHLKEHQSTLLLWSTHAASAGGGPDPAPKAIVTKRLTARFSEVVQTDVLFHERLASNVLIGEATQLVQAGMPISKEARPALDSVTRIWTRTLRPELFFSRPRVSSAQRGRLPVPWPMGNQGPHPQARVTCADRRKTQ